MKPRSAQQVRAEIQRVADVLATHQMLVAAYAMEMARLNRAVADGSLDILAVKWPEMPPIPNVKPVLLILPDGTPVINSTGCLGDAIEPPVLD